MLVTDTQFLFAELMDVVRLFGAEDKDLSHTFRREGEDFINTIACGGKSKEYRDKWQAEGELEFRRCAKRSAKLALYLYLSSETGKTFPWGALTGIRPTKMAYAELSEGRDFAALFKKFCVSEENIAIIKRVLAAQQKIYFANKNSGCDIFVSLPFCPTKCEYCSFITAPYQAVCGYAEEYTEKLISELSALNGKLEKVNSVYIGGGTPFCLENDKLERIYAAINALCGGAFEFTVEAGRPDTFTKEKLAACKRAGVTRVCVNPQTFSDETLARIGRRHTSKQTFEAYEMAKRYGFDINVDLIAGLNGETAEDFCRSIESAISLSPENITVHSLCLKSGSRLKEHTHSLQVSDIDKMIAFSRKALTEAGYEPYYLYRQKYQAGANENIGWCRADKACVYNVDTMEEICSNIAVGAGAISKRVYDGGSRIERLASPKDIPTYLKKCGTVIEEKNRLFE